MPLRRRHREYDRRIVRGTLVAMALTTLVVVASLHTPEAIGWLGFAGAPILAIGVMVNLARNGGMSRMTSGGASRRVYFALLALSCFGWGVLALFVLYHS